MNVPVVQFDVLQQSPLDAPVRLRGLGTAVPDHLLPQDLVQKNAKRILGKRYPEFDRLSKTFLTSGVEQRYSVAPFEWFEEPKNWPERTDAYLKGATQLFIDATKKALEDSGMSAEEIDVIVTVSSTGIATPTLEARAMAELNFRRDVKRVPVFGLGCAGGVSGLSIATRLAKSMAGANVLMVAVETCTLSFRSDRMQKADIIATVLFGDGAAAAILSSGQGEGPILGEGAEYTWPDTLPIMGWDVDDDGFGVVFDRSIPAFAAKHFREAMEAGFEAGSFKESDIKRLICHPGGAKVVETIESSMNLGEGALNHEREVLRDFGNMSAPTALFVLDRVLRDKPEGQMMLAALGPGFTAATLPILFENQS